MDAYLQILNNVLQRGKWKGNRTGIRTLTLPNQHFSHNMSEGFPLLTTKKMPLKVVAVELEGFLRGITSKKWYQERECKIWNEWANPRRVDRTIVMWQEEHAKEFTDAKSLVEASGDRKELQKLEDDLGPIYGYQWRRFGEAYKDEYYLDNGIEHGHDQLSDILNKLQKNPDDRRLVCSAWNPNQLQLMALPPCHLVWVLTHIDGELSLHWTQRSCDLFLGVPFNIASYALLLLLLCKQFNMKPGNLSGMLCDCHIYENHITQCMMQSGRKPHPLPQLDILEEPFNVGREHDLVRWTYNQFELKNYISHTAIKAPIAV